MQSLKASPQGLTRIRQAREQITQEKGWTVDNPQWLVEASSFLPLVKNGKGMVPGFVSIGTWKRFLAGIAIKPTNFKAFCQVLGLNWKEVVEADTILCPLGGKELHEVSVTQQLSGGDQGRIQSKIQPLETPRTAGDAIRVTQGGEPKSKIEPTGERLLGLAISEK